MPIVIFLLDTVFFFLVAATLLRAWLNQQRIPMTMQPGTFVMALTDWVVLPVRRILPSALSRNRIDWASLMSALLLSLAYGGIWLMLATRLSVADASPLVSLLAILTVALKLLLRTVLQGLMVLLLAYALLSWVQPHAPMLALLDRLCAPVLRPVRRWIPLVGGVDLSVLVLIIVLQIGLMLVS